MKNGQKLTKITEKQTKKCAQKTSMEMTMLKVIAMNQKEVQNDQR